MLSLPAGGHPAAKLVRAVTREAIAARFVEATRAAPETANPETARMVDPAKAGCVTVECARELPDKAEQVARTAVVVELAMVLIDA